MSRRRLLRVNMGPYESVEATGWVEIDTKADADELKREDVDPNDLDAVMSFLSDLTTDLVQEDAQDAAIYTDEENSFIHPYVADKYSRKNKR